MNGTTDTGDLSLDAPQRKCVKELSQVIHVLNRLERVSKNLGVYFIFCLFGLASLSFYASSVNKPVFLCFTSPSLAGFYESINFYRRGTLDFKLQ